MMGWKLVGSSTAIILAMLGVIFGLEGFGAEGFSAAIRWTARTSFVLFLAAFSASALRAAIRSPSTRWLLANRRYFGISFAISHLIHAAAIISLASIGDLEEGRTLEGALPGVAVYLFIVAMLVTSFDRTAAMLGRRAWKILHTVGGYLIFFSFFHAYGYRALQGPAHWPHVIVLLTVLGLRIWKWRRRRSATASA